MRYFIIAASITAIFSVGTEANARTVCSQSRTVDCFRGKLVLEPIAGSSEKRLKENFAYVDPKNVGWETSAGDVTNGASIPKILQPIVGAAFSEEFIAAAVIHDHYCDEINEHLVRPWRQTHRVFYDALLNQGVGRLKAKLMYYAVYSFGPRWGYLHSPQSCDLIPGNSCIKDASGSWSYKGRPANYGTPSAETELNMVEAFLEIQDEEPSLEELERVSDKFHEDDPFLNAQANRPAAGTGALQNK